MSPQSQQKFDFGDQSSKIQSSKIKVSKEQLLFVNAAEHLSDAQKEFNRLMKQLEKARAAQVRKVQKLDALQQQIIHEVMPLIEQSNRLHCDICFLVRAALDKIKFSARQREALEDLLSGRAQDILNDPIGLSEEDLEKLSAIIKELGPSIDDEIADDYAKHDFASMRHMLEEFARSQGVEIDLNDIDINGDPQEFERKMQDRLRDLQEKLLEKGYTGKPQKSRKPTKAQQEKERKQREHEEAKQRDLKSLYKQLAKAIHPDLENDPELKIHKEVWMKRLTAAHGAGDLHELLKIEMEWLGEESDNLTKASEEKLKIYHAVLKEQIREVKLQTESLHYQPQYQTLHRFSDDYFGCLPNVPVLIRERKQEIVINSKLYATLLEGDTATRFVLKDLAQKHRDLISDFDCPF